MKRLPDKNIYFQKAARTLATAQLLLREGDSEGACNRAYYAMFYAAQGALFAVPDAAVTEYKTHSGLIAAFGQRIVIGASMNPDLGRSIRTVQQVRQLADYVGDAPGLDKAETAVAQAMVFVQAIQDKFAADDA